MIKNFNEWNAALDGERMNEYFALAARLAEAERDAARYRYMRGVASFRDRNGPGLYWYLPRFLPGGSAEQLDASIDASITADSADVARDLVKRVLPCGCQYFGERVDFVCPYHPSTAVTVNASTNDKGIST